MSHNRHTTRQIVLDCPGPGLQVDQRKRMGDTLSSLRTQDP